MLDLRLNYSAFPRQREAHDLPCEVAGYFGGWGSGKTWWALAEGVRNTCYMPGVDGLLCSPTFPIQKKTLRPALLQMLPHARRWPRGQDSRPSHVKRHLGPMVREWVADENCLVMDVGRNGTNWYFGSLDNPGAVEGGTYGWGVLDEPRLVNHEGWRVFNSRIRDPRARVLRRSVAGVPTMGWMDEEFNRGVKGRQFVRASTSDNPHLPEGYIAQLNLSGRRAQAFLHGHFVHMEGTVFESYNPHAMGEDAGSVVDIEPEPGRATYVFIDFGRRRPYAGIAQLVDGLGLVIVDEVVGQDVLEAVHAERLCQVLQRWGLRALDCWVDPAGNTANSQTGMPSVKVYEKALRKASLLVGAIRWTTSPTERYIPNRIDAIEARLLDAQGRRKLFVARRLTDPRRCNSYGDGVVGIHRALLGYTYKRNRPGDPQPLKDGIHDHPCDALGYLVVGLYGVMEAPNLLAMNSPLTGSVANGRVGENFAEW